MPESLEPYINGIMVKESLDTQGHWNLPLFADGYPGIMFQQSKNGFYLLPKGKALSKLFLYGQTLEPVSIDVQGPFEFVVIQLYPFASKNLLGIDPKILNDDCFDLLTLDHVNVSSYMKGLLQASNIEKKAVIIMDLMYDLINSNKSFTNDRIQKAIHIIIENKGQIIIKDLLEQVHLTERTLERNFNSEIGLSPKQFARIIQFQCSLQRLNKANYHRLIEIGLDSGFSDQSHFIRTFKKYTGHTPSYYLQQIIS